MNMEKKKWVPIELVEEDIVNEKDSDKDDDNTSETEKNDTSDTEIVEL